MSIDASALEAAFLANAVPRGRRTLFALLSPLLAELVEPLLRLTVRAHTAKIADGQPGERR